MHTMKMSELINKLDANSDGYSIASANYSPKPKSPETFLSPLEELILRSNVPVVVDEDEEITALGFTGIHANRLETVNWKSFYNLSDYPLNQDPNPEIIRKNSTQNIEYIQELAIRYLQPPTPTLPGEIIIRQEQNILGPPAPPLIIRQQPPRPDTPEPIVFREKPPQPPQPVGRKIITISGKRLPPPPRKVIVERLAPIPSKPQSVVVERWLPYSNPKRKVIYERPLPDPVVVKPRNVIIQWEAPAVTIRQEVKHLDVIKADPNEYYEKYKNTITDFSKLPQYIRDIKPPEGIKLAANYDHKISYDLEGDIHALNLIDLEREGLSQYSNVLNKFNSENLRKSSESSKLSNNSSKSSESSYKSSDNISSAYSVYEIINNVVDVRDDEEISMDEAERIFVRLNQFKGKSLKKDELKEFLRLKLNEQPTQEDRIDLNDFKNEYNKL